MTFRPWITAAGLLLALGCASAPARAPSIAEPASLVRQTSEDGLILEPRTVYRLELDAEAPGPVNLTAELAGTRVSFGLTAGRGPVRAWLATGETVPPAAGFRLTAAEGVVIHRLRLVPAGALLTDRSGKDPTAWVDNPLGTNLPSLAGRGAPLAFTTYEAEDGTYRGRLVGPSRRTLDVGSDLAAEASGRRAVDLTAAGDFVEFTARAAANAVVVRFSIPDARGGKGQKAPLELWVDGVRRQTLTLTSEYGWVYGAFPWKNDPTLGSPRHFYDEVRSLVAPIAAGSKVRLVRPTSSGVKACVIDLTDLELVGPAVPMPEGFVSITDFGAVPNDRKADNAAIEAAQNAVKKGQAKGVYLPEGVWVLSEELYPDCVFQGAGMWYTLLEAKDTGFQGSKKRFELHDLAVNGQVKERVDSLPSAGFQGIAGPGSVIENFWITHTKVGMWTEKGTEGLVVRGVRIRDTLADGINLYRGAKNCLIENSHFRGTGDDSIALWSSTDGANAEPNRNNVIRNNTIQCPWLANGIAVYGGQDNLVENNVVADTGLNGAGIDVSSRFNPVPFSGTLTLKNNVLIRCGSQEGDGGWHGALWIDGRDKGISGAVRVEGLEIYDATLAGITVQGPGPTADLAFAGVTVDGAASWGLKIYDNASGNLRLDRVKVTNALSGGLKNRGAVQVILGEDNSGL